jgi:hypothetical protein
VNLYQSRAPSFAFFLANGWETTNLKERNQAVRELAGCGKTRPDLDFEGSQTGHDFSRADKANQIDVGL